MPEKRKPRPEADEDEAPVRKKKKKKKKETKSRVPLIAGIAGGGVVALALMIWAVVALTRGGGPAQPVTAWEQYSTEENEFGFDYPVGWKEKSYGIKGRREAEIKGPNASINVKENLSGSLVGDIAGAGQGGQPVDDDFAPVAKVHEVRRPKDSSTYQEGPAVTVTTRLGKARRSPFTDGSKSGYRATLLLHQTALDVFCECRTSDWATLKPAFEHVIESLGRGTQQ
jgi:hypothetical protein